MLEEPALYRFRCYHFNGFSEENQYILPYLGYISLGKNSKSRQAAYRGLFQSELDFDVINNIMQAHTEPTFGQFTFLYFCLNQNFQD